MKKTIPTTAIAACLLTCFFGCASMRPMQLTDKQKDQVKKEVITVFDSIMARLERLDAEGALQYYSPDVVAFGSDGERVSFDALKKYYIDIYAASTSYKWIQSGMDFIAVANDVVVISVDGRNEQLLKSGKKFVTEPSHYTFAFKKTNGQWKLFYHHFSGTFLKQ